MTDIAVAIPLKLCRICSIPEKGEPIINTVIGSEPAEEVMKLDGKVQSIMNKPCADCMSNLNENELFLIEIENMKTTGRVFIVSDNIIDGFPAEKQPQMRNNRLIYADVELIKYLKKFIRF